MNCSVVYRGFSTTCATYGKKNFRKFIIPFRGSEIFKNRQKNNPDPAIPLYKGLPNETGYKTEEGYVTVPEMIPELIVPDLTGFKLKPYVSYRAPDVVQSEFSAQDLFNAIYSKKIVEDFNTGKLESNGEAVEPSEAEKLTPEVAWIKARQTGSDIFSERSKREEEELYFS